MSKRNAAIASLIVSTALWIAVFLVPMLDQEPGTKWATAAGLYGGSYLFFFAAIALVGKEGFQTLKSQVVARFRRGEPDPVLPTPPASGDS